MKIKPFSWRFSNHGVIGNECTPHFPDGDMQAAANRFVSNLARRAGVPILLTLDAHMVTPDRKTVQDILLQNGRDDGWRFPNTYSQINTAEAWEKWVEAGMHLEYRDEFVEGVENNSVFASMIKPPVSEKKIHLPVIDWIPGNISARNTYSGALLDMTIDIIVKKGRVKLSDPEVFERLSMEIDVIRNNGIVDFLPYFLFLERICSAATEMGNPPGPGRGSAAGALLSYALGITQINPMEHDLSFARFLSIGRIKRGKFPDIDLDFGDPEAVANVLKDLFGDKCARISTVGTLKIKGAIKDAVRIMRAGDEALIEHVNEMTKGIMDPPQGFSNIERWLDGWEDGEGVHVGELERNPDLARFFAENKDIESVVRGLLGTPRSLGRHAAAYCVADQSIGDLVPLCVIKGETCTQYTMGPVEELGLIKVDILGLNTLNDIRGCVSLVEEYTGEKIDWMNLPMDCEKTWKAFEAGKNATVFQFNSRIGIRLSRIVKPKSLLDLAQMTAVGRPGVLDAMMPDEESPDGQITLCDAWVGVRNKKREPKYIHESVKDILEPTAGICVFQEQLSSMFMRTCGYSEEEADTIREIVGKKKSDKMEEILPDIHSRLMDRGWTPIQIDEFISICRAAAGYSFNKSHSVSYAYIGYACQWLKENHKIYWWTAVLRNASQKDLEKLRLACEVPVIGPDINFSDEEFFVADVSDTENHVVRYGLSMVKGVSTSAAEIMEARRNAPAGQFSSLKDFVERAGGRKVNLRVVRALILAGAFDRICGVRMINGRTVRPSQRSAIIRQLAVIRGEDPDVAEGADMDDFEALVAQFDAMPFCIPVFSAFIGETLGSASNVIPLSRLDPEDISEQRVRVAGYVDPEIREFPTRNGGVMARIKILDSGTSHDIVVWPEEWDRISGKMKTEGHHKFVLVTGMRKPYEGRNGRTISIETEKIAIHMVRAKKKKQPKKTKQDATN